MSTARTRNPAKRCVRGSAGVLRMRSKPPRHDHDGDEDQTGKRQVRGKPILADVDAVDEARRHHPPADGALETAQNQQADQFQRQPALDASGRPEEQQWQGEDETDAARQDTMRPFPPEDAFERVEAHTLVDLAIFRDLLVFGEFLLPFGIVQRRNDAVDRLPFGDRQAGIGEPRGAADENQRDQHHRINRASRAPAHGSPEPLALRAHRAGGSRSASGPVPWPDW